MGFRTGALFGRITGFGIGLASRGTAVTRARG
jgi:hypothetical protein